MLPMLFSADGYLKTLNNLDKRVPEQLERRRQIRGLLILAVAAIVFAIVRAGWNHAFLEELRDFPFGRKDDQVDALSRAFTMLTEAGAPPRRISSPAMPIASR